jgi:NADH:ubiquinone oxidoreductase subunit C
MDSTAIIDVLSRELPGGVSGIEAVSTGDGMPTLVVAREHAVAVCTALRDLPSLQFAFAPDITAVDYLPRERRFEVMVHLASLGIAGYGDTPKRLRVKFKVPGDDPRMPDLSGVWMEETAGAGEDSALFGIYLHEALASWGGGLT